MKNLITIISEFKNKIRNFDADKNEDKKDDNIYKDQYKDKCEYSIYFQEKTIQKLMEEKNQLKIKVNMKKIKIIRTK